MIPPDRRILPAAQAELVDKRGVATPPFYDFMRRVVEATGLTPDILQQLAELLALIQSLQAAIDALDLSQYTKRAANELISGQWEFLRPILGEDGMPEWPQYSFRADQDTGLYRLGEDNVGFATGGVAHWDINTERVFQDVSHIIRNNDGLFVQVPDRTWCGLQVKVENGEVDGDVTLWFWETNGLDPDAEINGFRWHLEGELSGEAYFQLFRHDNNPAGIEVIRFVRTTPGMDVFEQLRVMSGSTNVPGIGATTDPNTGLYWNAADNLSVTTGGNRRWTFGTTAHDSTLPIIGPNGSAASPVYSFVADPDTGPYSVGTNEYGIATGGALRFQIGSAGQLGIAGAVYGSDGQVLTSKGGLAPPVWETPSAAGGDTLVYMNPVVPSTNTIANTASETAFDSEYSVPVTDLAENKVIRVKAFGVYGTDATPPTLRLRIKLGSTTVLDTTAFTTTASLTDRGWMFEGVILVTTEGSSGVVEAQGAASFSTGAATANIVHMPNIAPVTGVDIDADTILSVTAEWGAAHADNTITLRQLMVNIEENPTVAVMAAASLLHFDGADGSTIMTDVAGKSWAVAGNAQLDTAQFKFGTSSLLLDGTGDHIVSMTDEDYVFSTGDFTIEMWVRFSSRTGNDFVFTFGGGWGVRNNAGVWAVYNGTSDDISGGTTADGTWYHVALSREGSNMRFFVDGTQIGSTLTNSTNFASAPIYIGTQSAGTNRLTGWIDELRITRQAIYTTSFTPPTAAFDDPSVTNWTVSLLHFDGTDGSTTFTDESGRTWTAAGNAQLDTAQFKYGTASFLCDGTGDYATSPDTADIALGAENFTVEGWVRFNVDPGTGLQAFVSHYNASGSQRGWSVSLFNNLFRLLYSTTGANAIIISAAWNPVASQWYHFAITRYQNVLYLFIDGALLGSQAMTDTIFDSNTPLQLGTQSVGADGSLNGWLDDVRITVGHARYLAAFTPPTSALPNPS